MLSAVTGISKRIKKHCRTCRCQEVREASQGMVKRIIRKQQVREQLREWAATMTNGSARARALRLSAMAQEVLGEKVPYETCRNYFRLK